MDREVDMGANTAPKIDEVWVFVSRDATGQENVLGSKMGPLGMQPLMTGNPRVLGIVTPLAKAIWAQMVEIGAQQTIHLLRFTQREEIKNW